MVRQRVRIRFSKTGNLKYIGHIDLMRSFETLFRRARLPLAMSNGYHPKVRMSFPSALALGVEGFDEVLELEMDEATDSVDVDVLLADLNRCSVNGLVFLSARPLGVNDKKAKLVSSRFDMVVPQENRNEVADRVPPFLAEHSVVVEKANGKPVDVRAAVVDLRFSQDSGELSVELSTQAGPEAGVREVLTALGLEGRLFSTIFPKRSRCKLADETSDAAPED